MIRHYEAQKWINGVRICKNAPSVTHMLFSNDSYLYCRANDKELLRVQEMLQRFEEASGQKVNLLKSSAFFSKNVLASARLSLCQVLQIEQKEAGGSYLGLPNMMGRSKAEILGFIKDKVRNRLQSWDDRWFSQAGKEILVKTVVQVVPSYTMSVFLIPLKVIHDLEKLFSKF